MLSFSDLITGLAVRLVVKVRTGTNDLQFGRVYFLVSLEMHLAESFDMVSKLAQP